MRLPLLSALPVLLAAVLGAGEVELSLNTGRTVRGEVLSETPTELVLRSRFPARGGTKEIEARFAKDSVIKRTELAPREQQFAERKAATPETVPELCSLAQWAYENCLREQARETALRVLAQEPDNAWAKRILDNAGYLEVASKWVDEAEYLKANNLARWENEIITVALFEARRGYQRAKARRDDVAKRLTTAQAAASAKPPADPAAKAKEQASAEEKLKRQIAETDKQLERLKDQPSKRAQERHADLTKAKEAMLREQAQATKDAAAAARQAAVDKASAEQLATLITTLTTDLAAAEAEVAAAAAKLPPGDPLLAAAATAAAPAQGATPPATAAGPAATPPAAPAAPPPRRTLRQGGTE